MPCSLKELWLVMPRQWEEGPRCSLALLYSRGDVRHMQTTSTPKLGVPFFALCQTSKLAQSQPRLLETIKTSELPAGSRQ